jgi:hypothetical protein
MAEDIMPDFHVVSLQYKLEHSENVTFNNPPPVELETDEGRLRLKDGVLSCELKKHYGTETEARRNCANLKSVGIGSKYTGQSLWAEI